MGLNELTMENLGSWPLGAKVGIIIFLFVVIFSSGGYFLVKPQFALLEQKQKEQLELQMVFEDKAAQAAVLPIYQQQIVQMRHLFKAMLDQLPSSAEIPDLVENISKMGVANGLEFELIRPDTEKKTEFYIELPIQMTVLGDYHQLSAFISNLAGLERIVTIGNFSIEQKKDKKKVTNTTSRTVAEALLMRLTASTYRYMQSPIDSLMIEGGQSE
jgi:type IV pilus assembly protein PilO